jgi:hypothetical protein
MLNRQQAVIVIALSQFVIRFLSVMRMPHVLNRPSVTDPPAQSGLFLLTETPQRTNLGITVFYNK